MNLVSILEGLNRRERTKIMKDVLRGDHRRLSEEFLVRLSEKICTRVSIDSYVAMDYQLSWLYAGLAQYWGKNTEGGLLLLQKDLFEPAQEDIDILIVDETDKRIKVIGIECKYETQWSSERIMAKIERFKKILEKCAEGEDVFHRLILMSKSNPTNLYNKHGIDQSYSPYMGFDADVQYKVQRDVQGEDAGGDLIPVKFVPISKRCDKLVP